ncbi:MULTISPECIES: malate synthase G [Pacificibacter]|uniref:malate synthase G n=1 Tax=Pacificibacter TaxID=1042323 RepID=UPI001C09985D|nr:MULTISPECIES: malate synthase G [Pacificibacter]MBU2937603.1 malate synthase G [Pacificibacter marinus]MDO6616898.1 malate synthase G [Pacificibacter sp. 1_MG-2023]
MTDYVLRHGLSVAAPLAKLVEEQVLLGVSADTFWTGYAKLLADLAPVNAALLAKRESLQAQIDAWHDARKGRTFNASDYEAFLREIGYVQDTPPAFELGTTNVDPEIATLAGPQLVVPVMNARFALNAANARWGSFYDALYGTDAVKGSAPAGKGFDAAHGAKVIAQARAHLDAVTPLRSGSWADVTALSAGETLTVEVGGSLTELADQAQFAGATDSGHIMLRVNGLLIEIVIDAASSIGKNDPAHIADIRFESALTAIQDCEDSVAAVDAEDKCVVYANWLGLMRGDLAESFEKGGKVHTRTLNPDVRYTSPTGEVITHPGRALLLVRNVGHLMTTDAVLMDGAETPEGMLDAAITVAAAMHDLAKAGTKNSRAGSIYVVKPKMHGPKEVAFTDTIYGRVEQILGLEKNTVKIGVMDEERRTSVNLLACIHAVKDRCVFINTGFLDRTGDEIHTSMHAGTVVPKGEMQSSAWFSSYEDNNVDAGLAAGLSGKGQIGKGMWAKPDEMAEMLEVKIAHPNAGANTAWVPSPTAATLHATHYHQVNVAALQETLKTRTPAPLGDLLTLPLMDGRNLSSEAIQRELDNSCQSILGYVVRWVDQGIGCSKVPDINDVFLMEDRATLRISSQYLANWMMQGLCSEGDIIASFRRMAPKVDAQNAGDAAYTPMAPSFDGIAFKTACDLVLKGASQPSGYTEPLLHAARRAAKNA